ncbi:MAG TPA: ABC transporter permease, partial [Terriglobales bacterium]|nr:ABC transporter permease [Terriglobales bacterium]
MNLRTILRQAARALSRNWIQSALSVLGIAVGVAAFICVVGIGNASTSAVEDQLKSLGDNFIWIEAGSRSRNGIRMGSRGIRTLVLGDVEAIRTQVPLIRLLSPNVDGAVQVVNGNANWATQYRGVTPDFLEIRRWQVDEGVFFSDLDVELAVPVCVMGKTVADTLFGDQSPVGQTVRVNKLPCVVVGVLHPKGISATGQDQDNFIVMPYTTAMKRLTGTFWLDDIFCSAVSQESMRNATKQIVGLLRERHHLNPKEDDDFNIRSPEDVIKMQLSMQKTMRMLLASIASLSLIVGGIGIMNIMLVSVTQRTREIGIRLAVGATEWDVQSQFLAEAMTIAILGGLLGMMLGYFSSGAVQSLFGFP